MGDSWNAYRAYADKVQCDNVEPAKVFADLPKEAVHRDRQVKFVEAGHVWDLPDGRVAETGIKSVYPVHYVWSSETERQSYRRALPLNLWLYA